MQTEIQKNVIEKICSLQSEIVRDLKRSLDNAIEIGSLLTEQKSKLPHGEFTAWIDSNMPFSGRTARNYMKLYENKDRLKTETVADLAGAYKLLTYQKEQSVVEAAVKDWIADCDERLNETKDMEIEAAIIVCQKIMEESENIQTELVELRIINERRLGQAIAEYAL